MYTNLVIRNAKSAGHAAAMWWSRALANPELKNGFTRDQLKIFEDELARSIDGALSSGRQKLLWLIFIKGSKKSVLSVHLHDSLRKMDVDYRTVVWPNVPEVYVTSMAVWRYDVRGTERAIWGGQV